MTIEAILTLILSLLFIIVLYAIINKHNKKNTKKYLQQKEDRILYEKDRKIPLTNTTIIFPAKRTIKQLTYSTGKKIIAIF